MDNYLAEIKARIWVPVGKEVVTDGQGFAVTTEGQSQYKPAAINIGGIDTVAEDFLLRDKWSPPELLRIFDGCWLYKNLFGAWFIANEQPQEDKSNTYISVGRDVRLTNAENLFGIAKQKFIPPLLTAFSYTMNH